VLGFNIKERHKNAGEGNAKASFVGSERMGLSATNGHWKSLEK
jgi:hypothetical protein